MKVLLRTLTTGLLMMIVFNVSSQSFSVTNRHVNKDSLVCYTLDENRQLAETIVKLGYAQELYTNCYNQCKVLGEYITTYQTDSVKYMNIIKALTARVAKCDFDDNVQNEEIAKLSKKVNRKNNWIKGLVGTSSILLLIVLL